LTTKNNFTKREIKLTPEIECIGIDFKYNQKYMDTSIILEDSDKLYSLFVNREDFNLNFPYGNDCVLN